MAYTPSHKRYWLLDLLFVLMIGFAYWFLSKGQDPETRLELIRGDLQHDDLIWWGQYLPVPLTGNDAFSLRAEGVIAQRLTQREGLYQTHMQALKDLIPAEENPERKAQLESIAWYLDLQLRGKAFLYHSFPLNPFSGQQIAFPLEVELRHDIQTGDAARQFVNRLPGYAHQMLQIIPWIDNQASLGLLPSRPVLDRSIQQMHNFVNIEPIRHPMYLSFARALTQLPSTQINEYTATDLLIQMERMLEEHIFPTYQQIADHLLGLKEQAKEEGGVASLPDGQAFYQYCLEYYVGKEVEPELIRNLAERESKALGQILEQLSPGFSSQDSSSAALSDEQADARKELFQQTIREMRRKTKGIFASVPPYSPAVRSMPDILSEQGRISTFLPAIRLSSRKASLFLNLNSRGTYAEESMIPLAYRFGLPGSYMASSYLAENDLRQLIEIPAWNQGWGLYAASLPVTDLRLLADRPKVYAGYVELRLREACLALVDVQLHTQQWTRQEAINYLAGTAHMAETDAALEVDRCLSLPGSACSSFMGEMKFHEIRSELMESVDEGLALKDFHEWILSLGPLPFDVFDSYMQDFLQKKLAG